MSRTLKEFTPGERNAYVVWNQRLADRTLTTADHDHARNELDKLFRRGPFAELHLLKDELQTVKDRLEALEVFIVSPPSIEAAQEHVDRFNASMGLPGSIPATTAPKTPSNAPAPPAAPENSPEASARYYNPNHGMSAPPVDEPVRADASQTMVVTQTADSSGPASGPPAQTAPESDASQTMVFTQTADSSGPASGPPAQTAPESGKDGRGRKPLRFHPEKRDDKMWGILDRDSGGHTDHGPYKTRREAKEMADTLNNMPRQPDKGFVGAVAGSVKAADANSAAGAAGAADPLAEL